MSVQTVLFDKGKWSVEDAKKWLGEHDFRHDKVDTTEEKHRFRQFDPGECVKGSYVTMTENMPDGIEMVSCSRGRMRSADDKGRIHKGFPFGIKSINEDEKSIVHVITDSTIDRSNEIVDPNGGHVKSFEKNPVVLFGHNYGGWGITDVRSIPIVGRSAWVQREGEAWISKTIFADATEISRDAWSLAKAGFMPAVSIGFMPDGHEEMKLEDIKDLEPSNRADFDPKTDIWIWRSWDLWEYSLVPVPANPNALERTVLAKIMNDSESQYVRGILANTLNEKRLCELEECKDGMLSKLSEMETLKLKIQELESKLEPKEPGKVAEPLSGNDLQKVVAEVVGGAFRRMTGKLPTN